MKKLCMVFLLMTSYVSAGWHDWVGYLAGSIVTCGGVGAWLHQVNSLKFEIDQKDKELKIVLVALMKQADEVKGSRGDEECDYQLSEEDMQKVEALQAQIIRIAMEVDHLDGNSDGQDGEKNTTQKILEEIRQNRKPREKKYHYRPHHRNRIPRSG